MVVRAAEKMQSIAAPHRPPTSELHAIALELFTSGLDVGKPFILQADDFYDAGRYDFAGAALDALKKEPTA